MTDRRGRLESDPFDHRTTADGSIRITRAGREVTVLRGDAARRLAVRLADAEPAAIQFELARATGQYRHGNERR
ncbi:MAG: hypothetical protein ABI628_11470 [Chloroflexota bacterium]